MSSIEKVAKIRSLGWFMGLQLQKVDCVFVIRVLAKRHSWRKFLGSLAKLGNCYNWPIGTKSSLDLDVILTRNILIWSQTLYHWATKSGNSQLHNRVLRIFVILLAARCHFGPIKILFCFWKGDQSWLIFCYIFNEELNVHAW